MKDTAASVRARLLAWAREHGVQFQYASMLYMQEGILARLAVSDYAEKLILSEIAGRHVQGALFKATQPPLPDVPPAAGFPSAEYRLAAIPRLPEERVGTP